MKKMINVLEKKERAKKKTLRNLTHNCIIGRNMTIASKQEREPWERDCGLLQCGGHLEAQSIMGRPGSKTKTKMAETRHTRERLKTCTVPQLGRHLRDRWVAVGADGGKKVQLVDKVFYESLLGLEVLPNEKQLIDNIAQRRNLALYQQNECRAC